MIKGLGLIVGNAEGKADDFFPAINGLPAHVTVFYSSDGVFTETIAEIQAVATRHFLGTKVTIEATAISEFDKIRDGKNLGHFCDVHLLPDKAFCDRLDAIRAPYKDRGWTMRPPHLTHSRHRDRVSADIEDEYVTQRIQSGLHGAVTGFITYL